MKKTLVIALGFLLVLSLTACSASSMKGYYERIDGKYGYEFVETEEDEGKFEKYEDGVVVKRDANKRNTNSWELDDDILILNDGQEYFKVYKGYMIAMDDEDEELYKSEYIAPEGDYFNYEISGFEFFNNGTFNYYPNGKGHHYYVNGVEIPTGERSGEYYRKNNIIYIKYKGETKYRPVYFIYDGDHIIDAGYVWIKK